MIESPVCTPIGSRFSSRQTTLSGPVAHHLELVFFPAQDRFLDQHLRGGTGGQAGAGHPAKIGFVVRQTRAHSPPW